MYKVLLFGGTVEGRTVAEYLNENNYPTNVWMKSRWKSGCYRWRTGWSSMRLIRMPR